MFVGPELLGVVDGRGGDLGLLEDRHGLGQGALHHPVGHQLVDLAGPVLTLDGVDVVGVLGQLGPVDGAVDPHGDGGRGAGDGQPLVIGGAVGVAGGAGVEAVAHPTGAHAQLVERQGGRLDQAGQRLDQVHVDELAPAAVDVAVVQRHHHRVGAGQRRHPVGQHERRERGRSVGLPGDVGEPAHGLGQGAVPGPVALGSASPVAGDVEHDHPGMGRVHRLVVDAPSRQRAGPVADHQHVADVEQLVEQLLSLGLAEVEGDAALVAAHALPHQADAVAPVTPGAHRVARHRRLHLDDLGPELAQGGADHRPGGQGGRLDHPQPAATGPESPRLQPWTAAAGRSRPRFSRSVAPGVAVAEHAAALQLGHHQPHDVLVGAGTMGGGDDEAVAGVGLEPLLHLVGHLGAGPHEARALEQGGAMAGQVAQRHGVAADVLADVLHQPSDARHRLDQLVGDRRRRAPCPRSRSS